MTEIDVNESEKWNFSCISDGNPLPTITCEYIFNSSVVGEAISNVTTIGSKYANCIDTGLYVCTGNNTIGAPVSKSAYIRVACKYFPLKKISWAICCFGNLKMLPLTSYENEAFQRYILSN